MRKAHGDSRYSIDIKVSASRRAASLYGGTALALFLGALAVVPKPAHAQDKVEEIVVTARKRQENLQQTPVAITAMTGQQLQARGAVDLTAIGMSAPNVVLKTGGGTSGATFTPVINIRGIGQGDFTINTDPGVGIYLDGVYLGRSVGSVLDLADIERVEVLRGPQGTLFGRNTIGGAVSLVSKAPSTSGVFGKLSATYGERNYAALQGSVNLPIGEDLALRLSGIYRHREGYVSALQYNDFKLGGEDMWGLRAALRYTPTSDLTIDLSADYTQHRDPPAATVGLQLGDVSTTSPLPTGTDSSLFNSGVGSPAVAHPPYVSVDAPRCASDAAFRDSSLTCYGNAWLAGMSGTNSVWTDRAGNKIEPTDKLDVAGYGLTVAWKSPIGVLKSISSYRRFTSTFYSDLDFTPFIVFTNNNTPYAQHQVSQELQLVGTTLGDRLDYVAGLYYFQEKGHENVDLLTIGDIPAALARALAPTLPYFQTTVRSIDNSSEAAYGQATYKVTEKLRVTGGLRWTHDHKAYAVSQVRAVGPIISATGELTSEIWTPMLNVAYQATPDEMIYATYSKGYRAGGFAARFPGGLPNPLPSFNPEYVTSYEVGSKSTLLEDRLVLNLAAFLTDYRDIQVTATTPDLPGFTLNLASARFTGVELETKAILGHGFSADGSIGYIHEELLRVAPNTTSNAGTNAVVPITSASDLPGPAWQLNLGLAHRLDLPGGGQVNSRVDLHYETKDSNSVANYAILYQGDVTLVDARVSYRPGAADWELALGAHNLLNEKYYTTKTLSSASGSAYGTVARPREVYVQALYRFGS